MVKVNRWAVLTAGCFIETSSGLNYSFSLLAPVFKARFGLSDSQNAELAAAINLGGYVAILSGIMYDRMEPQHNLGPRVVIWIGCVLMLIGWGGMWAQSEGFLSPDYWLLVIFCIIAGNAGTWWDTSVLTTNIKNFCDDRGSVLGILKAFIGLSTSVYASLLQALSSTSDQSTPRGARRAASTILAILAILPTALNLVGSLFINQVPLEYTLHELEHDVGGLQDAASTNGAMTPRTIGGWGTHPYYHLADNPHPVRINKAARFSAMYILIAVLAVMQAGSTLVGEAGPPGSDLHKIHALVLLALLCLALILPISTGPLFRRSLRKRRSSHSHHHHHHAHHVPVTFPHFSHPSLRQLDIAETGAAAPAAVPLLTPVDAGKHRGDGDADSSAPSSPTSFSFAVAPHEPHTAYQPPAEVPEGSSGDGVMAVNVAPASPLARVDADLKPGGRGSPGAHELEDIDSDERMCSDANTIDEEGDGADEEESSSSEDKEDETTPFQNLTSLQAMRQPAFWALSYCFLSGCGSGLTLVNNLAPLVISLGGHAGGQVPFVSLFSVANAAGRLLFGHISEHYLHKHTVARPVFLVLTVSIKVMCMVALASGAPLQSLYLLSLLSGFSFGGHWSTIPAIASDLFGLKNFAGIYAAIQLAPAVGTVLLSSWLTASVLAGATAAQGGGTICLGLTCFGTTWRVLVGVELVALAWSVWLWLNTRGVYAAQGKLQEERRIAASSA